MSVPTTESTTEPITEPIPVQETGQPGAGDPGHPPTKRRPWPDGEPPRAASRWWLLLGWLLSFLLLASHDIGQMTFDTKLGVDIDPVGFYQRLTTLWNPLEWFGGLQDQYIGYAFPMGTFYLLGHVLTVPVWLVERLWMSVLVAAGFWGVVRLAERIGVGGPRGRLLAGAVFALWPTYTIVIGSTSAAVLPGMLLPWAVLPLVRGAREGSTRAAAARSGLVVLAMGGVNAVVTIAALVVPALYLVTREPGRRRRSLIAWWVPSVLLATAWWLVTLFFQGVYGFNFLPYIEQAANTTRTMSATSLLHGSGNWTAYLDFGTPWLSAGWAVVSGPLVIVAVTVVSALGLYGLARRDLPEGRWLRLGVGIAALVALAGYGGAVGGLFHGTVQHLLDSSLAPLRNIYKFEPIVAFGLVFGLAHGLAALRERVAVPARHERLATPVLRLGSALLGIAVLVGLALPYASGQVLQPGAFSAVPSYWQDVANYLGHNSPTAPAMVVPADSHGIYTWGTPVDEPLEPLATSPWVQRDQVPFSSAGATAMLTAAEQAMESGSAVPGLATYLARAGIHYVVVRNDLDPTQLGYTPPGAIHTTLAESGFHRVASFGPQVTGGYIYPNTPLNAQALLRSFPSVEVFVPNTTPPAGPVATAPTDRTVLVDGDPGSLLQLADQGALTDQPVVMSGQPLPDGPAAAVVTDGFRRQDHAFGLARQNTSYTYTAGGTNPADDAQGDAGGPPRQMTPVATQGNQTVAVLSGAAEVTASSYGSWLWMLPQYDPVNAFDGQENTAWAVGRPDGSVGQWLSITFDHAPDLPAAAHISLLADTAQRPMITRITATTDAGSATTNLAGHGGSQPLRLPPGRTTSLRLTIDATTTSTAGGLGAGISEVSLPGVHVTRFLRPAQDQAGAAADSVAYSFHRELNPPLSMAAGEPESQFARTFTTSSPTTVRMSATATAMPGDALDSLLDAYRLKQSTLRIAASSSWDSLPQFRAANLIDGNYETGWVAGAKGAFLRLSWPGLRSVKQLFLLPLTGLASAPTSVRIVAADGTTRTAPVASDGEVDFPAMTTDQLDLSFPTLARTTTYDPALGTDQQLPVGLAELYIPALDDLRTAPPYPTMPLNLPCGQGPPVTVDGHTYQTSAGGTAGQLTSFAPIKLSLCTPGGTLRLAGGRHTITSPGGTGALALTDMLLSGGTPAPSADTERTATVLSWGAENRSVGIGPGTSTYLEVHQSYNSGWTATLDGRTLTPVTLDGWQQGFVVPAGQGGVITLSFPAGDTYRTALVGSAVGVVVLVLLAVLPARFSGRRKRSEVSPRSARMSGRHKAIGSLVVVALLFVVIGGWAAVLVPLLAALGFLRPGWLPWVAGGAAVAAGVCSLIGLAGHVGTPGYGGFGAPAQVFALAALAAALVPMLRRTPEEPAA